jgi:hypothetical protein
MGRCCQNRQVRGVPPIWRRFLFAFSAVLAAMAHLLVETALAQPGTTSQGAASKPAPERQKAIAASATLIPAETALILIRSTLLSLNDAVQTGNYTVLRDRSAPSFRERNTAADLSKIFSDIARRGIELSAVAILTPQMQSAPAIAADGKLLIKGYFAGQPVRIDFELVFEAVGRQWRIYALSVAPVAAPASVSVTPESTNSDLKTDGKYSSGTVKK